MRWRRTGHLCVLLTALSGAAPAEIVDRVAAVVEGEAVTFSDLRWLVQYRNLPVPPDAQEARRFYLEVLNQVIDQKLIAREALQTPGITIREQDVDVQIQAFRTRFPSEQAFQERLREMNMTLSDLEELIHRQLAVLRFVQVRFEPFIIVLPDQIEAYYNQEVVPQAQQAGHLVPPLELVEEQIRELLTVERTNQEMDRWVASTRRRSSVEILLYRDPPDAPNLPRRLLESDGQPARQKIGAGGQGQAGQRVGKLAVDVVGVIGGGRQGGDDGGIRKRGGVVSKNPAA